MAISPSNSSHAVAGGRAESIASAPNPFCTLSSRYYPNDIKQAFRTAWMIYKTNGAVRRAMYKMAEYPITDLIYDVEGEEAGDDLSIDRSLFKSPKEIQDTYQEIFEQILNIHDAMIGLNLDYILYGNAIPHLVTPWRRNLRCSACAKLWEQRKARRGTMNEEQIQNDELDALLQSPDDVTNLVWDGKTFKGDCPKCGGRQVEMSGQDVPSDRYEDLRLIQMNIFQVDIESVELSGYNYYTYTPSKKTREKIRKQDRLTLDHTPIKVLKACSTNQAIELNPSDIFHFKAPSPSREAGAEWGFPIIISCLQTIYFMAMLYRGMESAAFAQINPAPVISPELPPTMLGVSMDYAIIRNQLMTAYEESVMDPGGAMISPFPTRVSYLNSAAGRSFMALPEMQSTREDLYMIIGLPYGVFSGNTNFAGNSISMRVLENGFLVQRKLMQRLVDFLNTRVRAFFGLPKCKITLASFKMLDDVMQRQWDLQAAGAKLISQKTMLERAGMDAELEMKALADEARTMANLTAELNEIQQASMARSNADMQAAASATAVELTLAQIDSMADRVVSMVDRFENTLGYTRDHAVYLAANILAMERANAESAAAMNQASMARDTYLMERMSNATWSKNRADKRQFDFSLMGRGMVPPPQQAQQAATYSPQHIAQVISAWPTEERDTYLKSLFNTDPQTYKQVVDVLTAYTNNKPAG